MLLDEIELTAVKISKECSHTDEVISTNQMSQNNLTVNKIQKVTVKMTYPT